ncbi:MAG: hypothetical protein J6C26_06910 [Clostridia bacterium]|nr:hypothetical protein [Clostridia bacterium]
MTKKEFLSLKEIVLFGLFPAIMVGAQWALQALPNIHLTGVFIVIMTRLFRGKALIPLYVYILLMGVYLGFTMWWVPYLYVWVVLWGMAMLIPKNIPDKWAMIVYPIVCGLHGFLYGTLWAFSQPFLMNLPWESLGIYILNGIGFDITHGISNLALGTLILPVCKALKYFTDEKQKKKP